MAKSTASGGDGQIGFFALQMLIVVVELHVAAGNSVVLKPSEKSPLTALRLGELALQAGLPESGLNVVPGFGNEAGEALALHPDGLAPRILNLAQWREHLLHRLARQLAVTGEESLRDLQEELHGYPGGLAEAPSPSDVVLPLRIRHDDTVLSLFSIAAAVGTATDVIVEELSIELFHGADAETAAVLRGPSSLAR